MRNCAILLTLLVLTGCASTQDVLNTIPQAAGTCAGAAVFGGEVHMNPDPVEYVKEDVNREGRIMYNGARRSTQNSVAKFIELLFDTNK